MSIIYNRKSIRKYTNEQVSNDQVKDLLKAAMAAPSAGNAQPWDFIVVRNKDTFEEIMKISKYSTPLKTASVAIIVCGNKDKEKFPGYWVQDCSAATENILLRAEEIGLGGVWLGIYPEEGRVNGLKKIFNLPETITPLAVISIGYPDENRDTTDRFNEDNIHFETWGNKNN